MGIVTYISSIVLAFIGVLVYVKPQLIISYRSLSLHKKDKYPKSTFLLGFCFTAFTTPIVTYNIKFLGYETAANWSFIFTISLGVFITLFRASRKLNKN